MPIFLLTLLKSKYTWYALGAIAVVCLLLWVRSHLIEEGKDAGKTEARQQEAADMESMRKDLKSQLDSIVKDAQDKIAASDLRANAAQQQAQQQQALVVALASQRATASVAVSRVQDSDLHAYNVQGLGVRQPGDATSCYSPAEERKIADAVQQYPLCQKQVDAQGVQVSKLGDQIAAIGDKVQALNEELTAERQYSGRLMGFYTVLYNAQAPTVRGAKCGYLWKCVKKTIPVPAPDKVKP